MAFYKCKMCGGDLEVNGDEKVVECEYCGTKQTLPSVEDERLQGLFNRANILRMKAEFDKAEEIYEKILQVDDTEAEAHWGIILCKYGIEYVEDPATFRRVPTCHRTSFDAITSDEDYQAALQYADISQRAIYEEEAKTIDSIQKGILDISRKEKPFDVFICYKETDESGQRTVDSAIANDIYYQLKQEGYKVFYAAITLEEKLGTEYEPYIFAALNSAKVMLVLGTRPEYFNAVWVKNEWSRFLKIMERDRDRLLIPCFRDMDAYELPEEFAHLQAQDMSKIGFINDVVRGIKKVIVRENTIVDSSAQFSNKSQAVPLLERAFMSLEDGEWDKADEFCERALDIDPKTAMAYLGKLMAELKVHHKNELGKQKNSFSDNNNFKKTMRFADDDLKNELQGYIDEIAYQEADQIYRHALILMNSAETEDEYYRAIEGFEQVQNHRDSVKLIKECRANARRLHNKSLLNNIQEELNNASTIDELESVIESINSNEITPEIQALVDNAKDDFYRREENAKRLWDAYILEKKTNDEIINSIDELEDKVFVNNHKIKELEDGRNTVSKARSRKVSLCQMIQREQNAIKELESKTEHLKTELSGLGFFKISEKSEIQRQISITQKAIEDKRGSIIETKKECDSLEKKIANASPDYQMDQEEDNFKRIIDEVKREINQKGQEKSESDIRLQQAREDLKEGNYLNILANSGDKDVLKCISQDPEFQKTRLLRYNDLSEGNEKSQLEIRYEAALDLIQAKSFSRAIPILEELDGYKNSRRLLEEMNGYKNSQGIIDMYQDKE